MKKKVLSLRDVAIMYDVSERMVYFWLAEGAPVVKETPARNGRKKYFDQATLQKWLDEKYRKTPKRKI